MYVMLEGNLTEGFKAYGPYESFDDAADAHDCCEGWIMNMKPNHDEVAINISRVDKITLVGLHEYEATHTPIKTGD